VTMKNMITKNEKLYQVSDKLHVVSINAINLIYDILKLEYTSNNKNLSELIHKAKFLRQIIMKTSTQGGC